MPQISYNPESKSFKAGTTFARGLNAGVNLFSKGVNATSNRFAQRHLRKIQIPKSEETGVGWFGSIEVGGTKGIALGALSLAVALAQLSAETALNHTPATAKKLGGAVLNTLNEVVIEDYNDSSQPFNNDNI